MCGIAGRVNSGTPPSSALVSAMTNALAHRGPDDHNLYTRGNVALGHRRLAIIDRSGGAQPMSNEDGTVWIVYNGEVYNHRNLRRHLIERGHVFATRCDTEAIIHCHEEYGRSCATHLRGMFAYAIWDERQRRLTLTRDRLGIKPLYFAQVGGDILFASELRALLLDPSVDRSIDDDALAIYLALRYVPGSKTILRGVRKLEPGCTLTWENGEIRIDRYWDLLDSARGDDRSLGMPTDAEEAAKLRHLVDTCVDLRLMSEVPLGAFLSGGLDSTLIVASMIEKLRGSSSRKIKTFSVGYDDSVKDSELAWAALAATALGSDHCEVHVSGLDAATMLPEILWSLDEPIGDPASVPLWFLARRTAEEVTVVLSGEGADEIFGGYAIYRRQEQIERLRSLGLGQVGALVAQLVSPARAKSYSLNHSLESRYRGVSRAFDLPTWRHLLQERAGAGEQALAELLEPLWDATRHLPALERMLYLDTRLWLPGDILAKADKMTMASSLELRVPLLDHHLVEYAFALPSRHKTHGSLWDMFGHGPEGKTILRRAARGRVPASILERKKMGFSTPTERWLRGQLAPMLEEILLDPDSLVRTRLHQPLIENLLRAHRSGARHSDELWSLLALESWLSTMKNTDTFSETATVIPHRVGGS